MSKAWPWFGVEVEFIHAKAIADPRQIVSITGPGGAQPGVGPLGTVLPRFELSHGLNFVLANAVFRWAPQHAGARVALVARVGGGPTVPHAEITTLHDSEDGYQPGSAAFAAALGGEFRLSAHVAALVDVAVTHTHQHVEVGPGVVDGRLTTRHVIVGLMWESRAHPRP